VCVAFGGRRGAMAEVGQDRDAVKFLRDWRGAWDESWENCPEYGPRGGWKVEKGYREPAN